MTMALHFFPDYEAPAGRLAAALGIASHPVAIHIFPDGESLVEVGLSGSIALVYCSLDQPDTKLIRLLLAASALRDRGAAKVILIAPYLGYMRQDQAFAPGQAVSQKVIGRLLSASFDGLVTVDPHLHRTPDLSLVVPGIAVANVSAAPAIASAIRPSIMPNTVLVGPDEESRAWVALLAGELGLDAIVGQKRRIDDHQVEIVLAEAGRTTGRPVLLVDDMVSSGGTLLQCAAQMTAAGARVVGAVTTHCLAGERELSALARGGIANMLATDTIPGPVATIPIAAALAEAVRGLELPAT
ncbi:MAG: hypothetical protein RL339_545 [Pseudomonadota bacterium]|jgi:ribose-phosphate pyrophosphokinase